MSASVATLWAYPGTLAWTESVGAIGNPLILFTALLLHIWLYFYLNQPDLLSFSITFYVCDWMNVRETEIDWRQSLHVEAETVDLATQSCLLTDQVHCVYSTSVILNARIQTNTHTHTHTHTHYFHITSKSPQPPTLLVYIRCFLF